MIEFMAKHEKIITEQEYRDMGNDVPLRWMDIKTHFRTWRRMLGFLEQEFPLDYQALAAGGDVVEEPSIKDKLKAASTPKEEEHAK